MHRIAAPRERAAEPAAARSSGRVAGGAEPEVVEARDGLAGRALQRREVHAEVRPARLPVQGLHRAHLASLRWARSKESARSSTFSMKIAVSFRLQSHGSGDRRKSKIREIEVFAGLSIRSNELSNMLRITGLTAFGRRPPLQMKKRK